MERHDVGALEQLVERDEARAELALPVRRSGADAARVHEDLAVEAAPQRRGDAKTDPARSDDPDRAAVDRVAAVRERPPAAKRPARTNRSPSTTRRAHASASATAISAVASVSTPGVFATRTPSRRAAARSMFSWPTANVATTRSGGASASSSARVDRGRRACRRARRRRAPPALERARREVLRRAVDVDPRAGQALGEPPQRGLGDLARHEHALRLCHGAEHSASACARGICQECRHGRI